LGGNTDVASVSAYNVTLNIGNYILNITGNAAASIPSIIAIVNPLGQDLTVTLKSGVDGEINMIAGVATGVPGDALIFYSLSANCAAILDLTEFDGTITADGVAFIGNGLLGTAIFGAGSEPQGYGIMNLGVNTKLVLDKITGGSLTMIDGDSLYIEGSASEPTYKNTVNASSSTWSCVGNWDNATTGVFNAGTSTITFNGASNATITPGGTGTGKAFYNVVIDANGFTKTLGGDIGITNDFTNTAGTFDVSAGNFALNVGGSWTNRGTFVPEAGTVTLDTAANAAVSGDTTFFNLTCAVPGKHLAFEAGSTQTITNNLVLTGAAYIYLTSSTPGSYWYLDTTGATRDIHDVWIQDGYNMTLPIIDPANSIDSGNNVNWFYDDTSIPWTPNTINISSFWYEEAQLKKRLYKKGKYRTTVIVYEGKVLVTPYDDEQGLRLDEQVTLTAGQSTVQEGEVK
jgi:hypothetical protein